MKYNLFSLLMIFALMSCDKKEKETSTTIQIEKAAPTAIKITGKECYAYTAKNDTVEMTLTQNANNVNGELVYKLYQKDSNSGTFSGVFIGDTLYADYSFDSEGRTSVRETVFVKVGNVFMEGTGEMEERVDKMVFKDPKRLEFGKSIVLSKTTCR